MERRISEREQRARGTDRSKDENINEQVLVLSRACHTTRSSRTLRAAGLAIHDDVGVHHLAVLVEVGLQRILAHRPRQASNKQATLHKDKKKTAMATKFHEPPPHATRTPHRSASART